MAPRSKRSRRKADLRRLMQSDVPPDVVEVATALGDPECAADSSCSTAELFASLIAPVVAADTIEGLEGGSVDGFVTILHDIAARKCVVLEIVHPAVVTHSLAGKRAAELRVPVDMSHEQYILGRVPFNRDPSDPDVAAVWLNDMAVWHVRPSTWAWMVSRTPATSSPSPIDVFILRLKRRVPAAYELVMARLASGTEVSVALEGVAGAYGHFICHAEECTNRAPWRCRGPRGGACSARYCSDACQRADWARHRASCGGDEPMGRLVDGGAAVEFMREWERSHVADV